MHEDLERFCDRRSLVVVSFEGAEPFLESAAERILAHRQEQVVWFILKYLPKNLHYLHQQNAGISGYGDWQPFRIELARCGDVEGAGHALNEILDPIAEGGHLEYSCSDGCVTIKRVKPESVAALRDFFNGLWRRALLALLLRQAGHKTYMKLTLSSGVTERTAWLPVLALNEDVTLICEGMRDDARGQARGMSAAAETLLLGDLPLLLVGDTAVPAPPAYTCSFLELQEFVNHLSRGKRPVPVR